MFVIIGIRVKCQTEHIIDGGFELNNISAQNQRIVDWAGVPIPSFDIGNDNNIFWMAGSSWNRLGFFSPDLHETIDTVANTNWPAQQQAFHNLGCDNLLCYALNTTTADIDAWEGNYFVGLGGCEGVFQNLATPRLCLKYNIYT